MSQPGNEFRAGWPVLAAAFLGIATGVSSIYFYSLGIFIKPMAAEFGWSRGAASLGALVGTAGAAVASVPVGRIIDRHGSKSVALASLLLLAIGLASIAWTTQGLVTFLLVTTMVSLITAGSSPIAFTRLIVASFDRHRGAALGLALAGTGTGAILVPALLTPFVATHGWRSGYLALASVVLLAVPFVALLMARCPPDARADRAGELPLAEIARVPAFKVLIGTFFLAAVAVLGTVVHFVPMLGDLGLSPGRAGGVTALIGVAAIGGRLIAGFLLDRVASRVVLALLFVVAAVGLVVLGLGGVQFALLGALVTGLAIGAEVDLIAFLVARHFPPSAYGKTYGAIYAAFLIGGAIGPALAGLLRDAGGDYRLWLWTASALLLAAALVGWRLPATGAPAGVASRP